MSAAPVFALDEVAVHLGAQRGILALGGVTLVIEPGERVALIGPNGSGKSTLLRTLHGLLPLAKGERRTPPRERQSMLFQRPYLLRLSAINNIRLALWIRGKRWRDTLVPAQEALARVGLAPWAQRNARALSGGQQQRLALARAWALKPEVWLLDEPTASLDPHAKKEVEALIAAFAAEPGSTLVFSSHNLGQVKRLATRVIYLEGGRLLADLPVQRFFDDATLAAVCPQAAAFCRGELS